MRKKRDITKEISFIQKFLDDLRSVGWQAHEKDADGNTLFRHDETGEVKRGVDLFGDYKANGIEAL